ncbi:MAG: cupin domain-containing protein [Actinomycetota bacterium]|nr:cupin domain-containing protein [Actinomycetota bacterium]
MTYTFIPAVPDQLEIPDDGTLSRILYRDERLRVVGFAFDEGQELTEHTAAVPALIQVLTGKLSVGLGDDTIEMGPGDWLRMDAHLAHSLRALEPSIVLLTMLPVPK